jgi:hypothetical protein
MNTNHAEPSAPGLVPAAEPDDLGPSTTVTNNPRGAEQNPAPPPETSAANAADAAGKYEIGYKRPPKHTRFKKGRSGNPRGRPKKLLNVKGGLKWQFLEKVTVQEGSRRRRVAKIDLLVGRLIANGIKGDTRSALAAYKLAVSLGVLDLKDRLDVDMSMLSPEDWEQIKKAHEVYSKHRLWDQIYRVTRDNV